MHVYSWRQMPNDVVRFAKRPGETWTSAEVEGLPVHRAASRAVFNRLIELQAPRAGAAVIRVGICTDLSPDIGVYRNDMAEVSRRVRGDRVEITWLRGFWASMHVMHRTTNIGRARMLARDLIEGGKAHGKTLAPNKIWDVGPAGRGETRESPFYIYAAIQIGGAELLPGKIPFDAVARTRARDLETGGGDFAAKAESEPAEGES